jgi:acyl-CoA thioesterase-2
MAFHSLHAYFLRPGRADEPIRYSVEVLKDGKNFCVRQVLAYQHHEVIFAQSASFTRGQPGIEHQYPAPSAPPPEQPGPLQPGHYMAAGPRFQPGVELRNVEPPDSDSSSSTRYLWMRAQGRLPDDPLLHVAAFIYMSDRTLMGTGARPHRATHARQGGASLDHALWLHRPARFEGWILYAMDSPAAHDSRAWNRGAMYLQDGTRILSVAQEGLLRMIPLEL